MKKILKIIAVCSAAILFVLNISGCRFLAALGIAALEAAAESDKNKTDSDHIDLTDDDSVQSFSSGTTFEKLKKFHGNLSNITSAGSKNLYTIQVNRAQERKYETGYIYPDSGSSREAGELEIIKENFRKELEYKTPSFVYKFNQDPVKFMNENNKSFRAVTPGVEGGGDDSDETYVEQEERTFKVAKDMNDTSNSGTPKKGKLVQEGDHCLVYLAEDVNFSEVSSDGTFFKKSPTDQISDNKIDSLVKTFDSLYPYITSVMGTSFLSSPFKFPVSSNSYKYTVSDNKNDCPEKVIIFINDIFDDKTKGNVLGYFWSADLMQTNYFENSNGCKMFYLDSYYLMKDQLENTKICDSTLAHEFTHMLNVINKKTLNIDTWFTEMLAMTCEDIVSGVKDETTKLPILGFNTKSLSSVFFLRLPYFNLLYGDGFSSEVWGKTETYTSAYSNTYAFGAYLLRNYGGVKLINQIATNNSVGIGAINDALNLCGYSNETFETVLSKFGQVLLNTDEYSFTNKTLSLNKGTTSKFNSLSYPIFPIDLNLYYLEDSEKGQKYTGPQLKDNHYRYSIGGWGVEVKEFGTVSDYKTFDAQLPTNQSCDLYVYIK